MTGFAAAGMVAVIALVPEPALSGAQRVRSAAWWSAHLFAGAVMVGMPAMPSTHARRVYSHFTKLPELVERVKKLEKEIFGEPLYKRVRWGHRLVLRRDKTISPEKTTSE